MFHPQETLHFLRNSVKFFISLCRTSSILAISTQTHVFKSSVVCCLNANTGFFFLGNPQKVARCQNVIIWTRWPFYTSKVWNMPASRNLKEIPLHSWHKRYSTILLKPHFTYTTYLLKLWFNFPYHLTVMFCSHCNCFTTLTFKKVTNNFKTVNSTPYHYFCDYSGNYKFCEDFW